MEDHHHLMSQDLCILYIVLKLILKTKHNVSIEKIYICRTQGGRLTPGFSIFIFLFVSLFVCTYVHFLRWKLTATHSLSLRRDIPEWPHQSCQPNLNHFTNVKWITRWEGKDGITLHFFPAFRCWELDQLFISRHPNKDLKWPKLCFVPI